MHLRKNEAATCGFTLIEIMIVVAIVAILATIAYPSYQESVRKARRAEAKAALLEVMQQQERYYTQHNTYIAFSSASTDADAKRFKWFSGSKAADSAYEISGVACGDGVQECILLRAVPGTNKVDAHYSDARCGTLTLSSTGAKGAQETSCWN